MKPFKLLHVMAAVAPRYGGPSSAIWPMLNALHNAGVDVELVTTDADGPSQRLSANQLPKVSFPVHLLPGPGQLPNELAAWVRSNIKRFNILHTHGIWHRHGTAAMSESRRAGVPYVIRTCGMLAPYSWKRRWWKKRPYWWLFERANVRGAAVLHVTSPGERAEVEAWRLPASVCEIPLGLDASAFDTPRQAETLRKRCGTNVGNRPIVLFLGRLHPVKGITDVLLPAFSRMKTDAFLAIVGGPAEDAPQYESEITSQIQRLGIEKSVALLGAVSGSEKWGCYDGAAVYVQPSRTENFGLSVAEAMARGCPVIVTEGVQSRSVVEAANGGWIVPYDPNALAATLDVALSDSDVSSAKGRAGCEYVRQELGWDRIAEKLATVYQTLIH